MVGEASGLLTNGPPAPVRALSGMRSLFFGERHPCEAHDALLVDIPLLVAQQFAARVRRGLEEGVKGRRAAPFQIVTVLADLIPEAAGIAHADALDTALVTSSDLVHDPLIGHGGKGILVTRPHVRHVHPQYPEQSVSLEFAHFIK